ncbi:MAG TPA: endolytic transglycosylase MltG [Bacteroidales bacterium]|nr:endolytic transglycosylase MltG [Bacteroidales bacterium]HSA43343.1 endolytic transglycosylase MltG [Bacteroidales bacterium]
MTTETQKTASGRYRWIKWTAWMAAALIVLLIILTGKYLWYTFHPNTRVPGKDTYLYIATGSGFEQVLDSLLVQSWIKNPRSFAWVAEKKQYPSNIKPGRYRITNGMNNLTLVNMLRSGAQEPLKLTFNNTRTLPQLAGKMARQLEADSVSLLQAMRNAQPETAEPFTRESLPALFIPNTYEVYWNVSPERLIKRLTAEYLQFWNEKRTEAARQKNLSRIEVSILASIVEAETQKNEEKPAIAGVYLNRLRLGMRLEADPTLKFAMGNFDIQRVLSRDKLLESPYNTYRHQGLPPGPINMPSIASIDAVLNAAQHNYLFFCARDDLSGYHVFSTSLSQHMRYAKAYHSALNKLNIKR